MDTPTATEDQPARRSTVNLTFYVGLALYMIVIAIVGFWPTYFGPLAAGTLDAHWVIHAHSVVFLAWLLLFLGQTALASRGDLGRHQAIGKTVGIVWGLLLIGAGFFLAFAILVPGVGSDNEAGSYAPTLLSHLGSLSAFAGFFGAGVFYRRHPTVHKRLMVLATVALMGAPLARLAPYFGGGFVAFLIFVVLRLSPLFAAMGYDHWMRGRVHPTYWIGTGVMTFILSRFFWSETDIWLSMGNWLIENMQPVVEAVL